MASNSSTDPSRSPRRRSRPQRLVIEGTTDSLQLFLQEVGRYPLLTKLEEIQLAKRVEAGRPASPSGA